MFIHLNTDELNQARVAQRVSEGGLPRTLGHIRTVLPLTDQTQVYDNSSLSQPFVSVAHLSENQITQKLNPLPEWAVELLKDYI